MEKREYTVTFLTPAFLGGADQSGQWRTPPFKHLLREWWRVAWAAKNDPADWKKMREVEARLFGHAWLSTDRDEDGRPVAARRSRVLLRLEPWERGRLNQMPQTQPVGEGRQRVPSGLYLGYGPVGQDRKSIRGGCAIDAGAHAELHLAFCEQAEGAELLGETLSLIQAFGTVGSRARNGWGSVHLLEGDESLPFVRLPGCTRDWRQCLNIEWPCAIGEDEKGPLIWSTQTADGWRDVVWKLARVRKAVNEAATRQRGRHIVSAPVPKLARDRMPGCLRFKVRRLDGGRLRGIVFHMPYLAPPLQAENRSKVEAVWDAIHQLLDEKVDLKRIGT